MAANITCNPVTNVAPGQATLPASIGGACFVDEPITGFYAMFTAPGVMRYKTPFGAGYIDHTWLPDGANVADFEIRATWVFAGSGTDHDGPASGVWVNAGTGIQHEWRVIGSGNAADLSGSIQIRRIATGVIEATSVIESTFISQGVECP